VLAGRLLGNKALLQAYLTPRVIIPAVKPYRSLDYAVDFPRFARHQIALESNSRRGVYERQTIYRRV
jgi:hypothetical protein